GNYLNIHNFNNRPFMTGHSYRNYCYSSVHKRMVKHHPTKYTYLYDPTKMDWDTAKVLNPVGDGGGIYNACLTNTPHGAFGWIRTVQGCCNSFYALYMLDETMTWKRLKVKGDTVIPEYYTEDGNAMYDSKRDRMLFVSGTARGQVWAYSFKDSTMTKLNPTGDWNSSTTMWREGVYLPAQDKLLLMGNLTHRMYNCATNSWENLTVTKATGVGTTASVSSGYAYDPKRDLVWDIEINCEVYVMRVAGGYNPDSIPTSAFKTENVTTDETFEASPNPFNPSINVTIRTISDKAVSVAVYDLNGRLVATLLKNKITSGQTMNLAWDGKTNGRESASGTYFIRQYIGEKLTKTLMVVKTK
ncbi:MAG: T9SS type A sorting domain-containing protein, partial [Fibrobacteres bacterium]|nr:T9SS type A sorting domain-containing protein [Fibrobacterota bacterium]